MSYLLNLVLMGVLAYVFRAQLPALWAAAVTDFNWIKSWFVKAPVAAPAPAAKTDVTPANSNTA